MPTCSRSYCRGCGGRGPNLRIAPETIGAHDPEVWQTVDPDERSVELTAERWRHIIEKHPELDVTPEIVLSIVAMPALRTRVRERGEDGRTAVASVRVSGCASSCTMNKDAAESRPRSHGEPSHERQNRRNRLRQRPLRRRRRRPI